LLTIFSPSSNIFTTYFHFIFKQKKINSDSNLLVKKEDECKKFVGAHVSIAGQLLNVWYM
jgi:hypothetical protein